MPDDFLSNLQRAIDGLFYLSESDEPFVLVHGPKKTRPIDRAAILKLSSLPSNTHVETQSVEEFFADLTKDEDWHGAEEKAEVQKYRKLREVITQGLTDVKVFRAGKVKVDIFIVGRTPDGALAGVRTKAVET